MGGGVGHFTEGILLLDEGNLRRSDFDDSNRFQKLKAAFWEYWTSIKIKINMTFVFKGYEIKTKHVITAHVPKAQVLILDNREKYFVG